MNDFRIIDGFEDVWRPLALPRRRPPEILPAAVGAAIRARLARLTARVPEVMVKVTGRTRDGGHLAAHLDYISRNGALALEDDQGLRHEGRTAVRDLATAWATEAEFDRRRRAGSPLSHALIFSMPAGTDAAALEAAVCAFAGAALAGRFEYVMALHTDTDHPHVHLTVRSRGLDGERFNPKKADLDTWRRLFAQTLRDRGVEAEATPRRARGITRKAQTMALRKLGERCRKSGAQRPWTERAALGEAASAAIGSDGAARPWEAAMAMRQRRIRALYLAQAKLLASSQHAADRALAEQVEAYVRAMPAPDSRRLALARALRAVNAQLAQKAPGGRER